MAIYTIGGVAVNDLPDWQHMPTPGRAQGVRITEFPGITDLFATVGSVMPGQIVIVGFLQGTSATSSDAAIAALNAELEAQSVHQTASTTVVYRDEAWSDCLLMDVRFIGSVKSIYDGDTYHVQRRVQFTWQRLTVASGAGGGA